MNIAHDIHSSFPKESARLICTAGRFLSAPVCDPLPGRAAQRAAAQFA